MPGIAFRFTTALLLLYYCFTTGSGAPLMPGIAFRFTTALLLLYYCFVNALQQAPERR
jgi:hypothetical protein